MYKQWREQVFDTLPVLQVFLLTKHVEVCNFSPHCIYISRMVKNPGLKHLFVWVMMTTHKCISVVSSKCSTYGTGYYLGCSVVTDCVPRQLGLRWRERVPAQCWSTRFRSPLREEESSATPGWGDGVLGTERWSLSPSLELWKNTMIKERPYHSSENRSLSKKNGVMISLFLEQ
jgi:hypothetical protein